MMFNLKSLLKDSSQRGLMDVIFDTFVNGAGSIITHINGPDGEPLYKPEDVILPDRPDSYGVFGDLVNDASEASSGFFGLADLLKDLPNLIKSIAARYTGASLTGAEREANEFNAVEAEKARHFAAEQASMERDYNSTEASLNRQFQAGESSLNRRFQAAEAEKARVWQEEQYLRYNSPSALMSQYKEAGLNPALMYGGYSPSPASTSTPVPSGSMASGSAASAGVPGSASASSAGVASMLDLVSMILGVSKYKSEIALTRSQAQKNLADASLAGESAKKVEQETIGQSLANEWNPWLWAKQLDMNTALTEKYNNEVKYIIQSTEGQRLANEWNPSLWQNELDNGRVNRDATVIGIAKVQQEIMNLVSQNQLTLEETNLKKLMQGLTAAQISLTQVQEHSVSASTWYQEFSNQYVRLYGHKPDEPIWNAVTSIIGETGGKLRDVLSHPGQYFKGAGSSFVNRFVKGK